jgi:hypothetical protein
MSVQNAGPNGTSHHTKPSEPQHSHCTSSSLHALPATRGHNLPPVITATSPTSYINSHCHLTQLRAQSFRLQPQRATSLSPYSAGVLGWAASQQARCSKSYVKYGIYVPRVSSIFRNSAALSLWFPGFARSSFW